MKRYHLESILVLGLLLLSLVFSSCQGQPQLTTLSPPVIPTPVRKSQDFFIIGYITPAVTVEAIPFDKITHLNYAFVLPNADGTLQAVPRPVRFRRIIDQAQKHGIKVLISIGGWGYGTEFETLASDPESRAVFITEITQIISEFDLDGVDIDWEYPSRDSRDNFHALASELRSALPDDLILTAAVAGLGENAEGVPAKSFEYFNHLNIMAYDGIEHASLNFTQNALDYWQKRGLQKGKTVLGIPFYSRPILVPYRELVEKDPAAAFLDDIEYQGSIVSYNGIPTAQLKTRVALARTSGIMIWTLEFDSINEKTSLLHAIHNIIQQE